MNADDLFFALKTRELGRHPVLFETLPSTQTHAQTLALAGCPHGTLVYTRAQTQGRGRAGRTWLSGKNALTFSFVINRGVEVAHAADWSFVAGLAVYDAFAPQASEPVALKWPNDVLIARRKFAGILCSLEVGPTPTIVCGIGVNLDFDPGTVEPALRQRAGTFSSDTKEHEIWLGRILRAFEQRASDHQFHGRGHTCAQYRKHLALVGEEISVTTQAGMRSGTLSGISDDFELMLTDGSTLATAEVWPL